MANEVNYNINYDDERFKQVQADKQAALSDVEKTYGGMIGESDKYYQAQIDASKQWADKQTQLQQEQTDFAIEEINQQKQQAQKDFMKEQSSAYVDWQKQSNKYGANAEKQADIGMAGTGFSESAQVSMYNTYQNRVATARESYNQAVQGYNNAITQARLQNNSILAEIAFESLQQQLELSLQGFQYKNNLVLEQANKKLEVDNTYYARYQDVLNQINTENALAEEIRQYNQQYELQVDQFEEEVRQFNMQYNENVRQFNKEYDLKMNQYKESIRQFNEEIARLKKKDAQEYALEIQNLELQKKKVAQEQSQFEAEMKLKKQQLEEEKRQFNASLAASKKSSSSGGSGGSTSSNKVSGSSVTSTKASQQSASEKKTANSIMALGYGSISGAKLDQLVASGEVEEYKENGVTLFRKVDKKKNQSTSTTKKALTNGMLFSKSRF